MLNRLRGWWRQAVQAPRSTQSPQWRQLWPATLARYPFLEALPPDDQTRLEQLTAAFLAGKEFTGAQGLEITDVIAMAVAAQACLPLLHLLPADATPAERLDWYDDFVGVVLHPGEVWAPRRIQDDDGVVHQWHEALSGEAMPGGPVMLSWADVERAGTFAREGYNVVIHEFAHKLDLHHGPADGCPPLPPGFAPGLEPRAARQHWQTRICAEYEAFCEQVAAYDRFGVLPAPRLDRYAGTSVAEFFAVASEAYFVHPELLTAQSASLHRLLQAYYRAGDPGGLTSRTGCPLP